MKSKINIAFIAFLRIPRKSGLLRTVTAKLLHFHGLFRQTPFGARFLMKLPIFTCSVQPCKIASQLFLSLLTSSFA
jgi:hypothetical protein